MEFLKPFISISFIGLVAYVLGIILVEGAAQYSSREIITRSRKRLYIIRAISFSEYIFMILISVGVFYVSNDRQSNVPLFAIVMLFLIRLPILFANTDKIRHKIIQNRLVSHITILLFMFWIGASLLLFKYAHTEVEKILTYLFLTYFFILIVFAKSRLTDRFLLTMADITLNSIYLPDYLYRFRS